MLKGQGEGREVLKVQGGGKKGVEGKSRRKCMC